MTKPRSYTLSEVCRFHSGDAFKKEFQGQSSGHFPFIKFSDMNLTANQYFINTSTNWVSAQDAESRGYRLHPPGAVVFAKIGVALTYNRRRILSRSTIIDNNMMSAIPDRDCVDPKYFYYLLSTIDFNNIASGSALPYLTVRDLSKISVYLPPMDSQIAISECLTALDDKIELNRRMNETLEAMARAIFKSWFVDFGPTRAKAEGRTPYLAPELWEQFPDRLVASELGEIPEGWEVAPLGDLIELNPKRMLRKGQVAPYLDMASMPTKGHTPDHWYDRPYGSGMRFTNGDTLLARITPCLENGKTAYVDFLRDRCIGWGSTEYIVMRSRSPFPTEFAYCLARRPDFREFAIHNMTGTSGRQRVPAKALSHFALAAPSKEVARIFGDLIQPLFAQASANARTSRTLAQTRDLLLPKLMSGEIRLREAEKAVEAVA